MHPGLNIGYGKIMCKGDDGLEFFDMGPVESVPDYMCEPIEPIQASSITCTFDTDEITFEDIVNNRIMDLSQDGLDMVDSNGFTYHFGLEYMHNLKKPKHRVKKGKNTYGNIKIVSVCTYKEECTKDRKVNNYGKNLYRKFL